MKFETKLGIALILSSVVIYTVAYFVFHDLTFIEKYTLIHLGFLPISVLLVTLILNRLIERREKMERLEKLNIVIGSFYAEIGDDLLRYMSKYDANINELVKELISIKKFGEEDFKKLKEYLLSRKYEVSIDKMNLYELKKYLAENKEFIVNLLDNPMLIEHDTFTDLLWNILHVTEEMRRTINFENLPPEEYSDLKNDIENLYKLLAYEWVNYLHYLKDNYPHIFKYEMKTNPFFPHAYHSRLG